MSRQRTYYLMRNWPWYKGTSLNESASITNVKLCRADLAPVHRADSYYTSRAVVDKGPGAPFQPSPYIHYVKHLYSDSSSASAAKRAVVDL